MGPCLEPGRSAGRQGLKPAPPPAATGDDAVRPRSLAAVSSRRLVGLHLAIIAAAGLVWMLPLMGHKTGWWQSANELNDLFRTHGVYSAWKMGHWEARSLPSLDFGYGYPVFFFEAPLYYWIGALLEGFFGDLVAAMRVEIFGWLMVGALGAYALADRWWTRHALTAGREGWAGPVGALAWLASPLGMVLLMGRGDGAAFAAAQVLPWVACLAMGVAMRRSAPALRDVIDALVLAAALTILWLLDAALLPAAALVLAVSTLSSKAADAPWSRYGVRVGLIVAASAAAMVMTAWWWVPALVERGNIADLPTSPAAAAPAWRELLAWRSVPLPVDIESYRRAPAPRPEPLVGILAVAAVVSLGVSLLGRRRGMGRALVAPMCFLAAALALVIPMAPWLARPAADAARALMALGVALAIPAGAVAWAADGVRSRRVWVTTAAMGVLLLGALFLCGRTVPSPRSLWGGYFYDARMVPRETTTTWDDYAPRWRARRGMIIAPDEVIPQANAWQAPAGVRVDKQGPDSSRFEMKVINTTDEPVAITVALNYYPGWTALLESASRELPVSPSPEGFVRVDNVPPGQHNLRLYFGTTPMRSALWALSSLAMIGWLAALWRCVAIAREAAQRVPTLAPVAAGDVNASALLPRPLMESAVVGLPRSGSLRRPVGVVVLVWLLLMGAMGQRWSFLFDSVWADAGVWLYRVSEFLIAPVSILLPRTPRTTPPPGLSLVAALFWLGGILAWLSLARWMAGSFLKKPSPRPPQPDGPEDVGTGLANPERRALLATTLRAAPVAVAGSVAGYSVLLAPERLQVEEYTEAIADLPPALDGLRIVQLSDIHLGPYISADTVRRALHRARELKPDLILLTGDYVHRTQGLGFDMVARLIADETGARHGMVATLGNHDHYEGAHLARRAFAPTGIPVIDNTRVFLSERGLSNRPSPDALCLAGVGDLWTDRVLLKPALADVPESMPRLLLSHHPDVAEFYRLDAQRPQPGPAGVPYWVWHTIHHNGDTPATPPRIDLMLAGHTHGGQVRLPGIGSPVVPSYFGQKYAGGRVDGPHWPVIISRGVGMAVLPVRFGVPPEIGLIRLKRKQS